MDKDTIWKIASGVIAFLLSLSIWFAQTELADIKKVAIAQGKVQDKLAERMAHNEGWHECERQLKGK